MTHIFPFAQPDFPTRRIHRSFAVSICNPGVYMSHLRKHLRHGAHNANNPASSQEVDEKSAEGMINRLHVLTRGFKVLNRNIDQRQLTQLQVDSAIYFIYNIKCYVLEK